MAIRNRNHRRNGCGSCETITQAHHFLTIGSVNIKDKLLDLKNQKIVCEEINGLYVFIFPDSSLLAYDEKKGFYKVDSFLRKSQRRLS